MKIVFTLMLLLLTGCASQQANMTTQHQSAMMIAEPVQADIRLQKALVQLDQLLLASDLSTDEQAELFYRRATVNEALGLDALAFYDYHQAIQANPRFAKAYNALGVFYASQGEFDKSFEAFDAALELDADNLYPQLNRGIALFYAERFRLAEKDLDAFSQVQSNPTLYRLWQYFIKRQLNQVQAEQFLQQQIESIDPTDWNRSLLQVIAGQLPEGAMWQQITAGLNNQQQLTERLCEVYFYLGKWHALEGRKQTAANYFKLSLSTNIYQFIEHRYSRVELYSLRRATTPAQ